MKVITTPLAGEHPQLFHYTSAAGLDGIIQSQTLRATHYAYLNDAEEIKYFLKKRLPEIFEKVILSLGFEEKEACQRGKQIAKSLQDKLLNSATDNEPLAEPYITSFCTTRNSDERVDKHGLLSQWRGYGKDGGYALVFDTKNLSELLTEFSEKYENCGDLFGGNVVYSNDSEQTFSKEFEADLATMETFLSSHLRGADDDENLENIFIAIMRCACRYKHWGFKEENEVRLVFIPHNKETREYARREGITINHIQQKQYVRFGKSIPFVDLLEGITSATRSLPIQRVIIGPCAEHERARRVRAVEILLRQHDIDAKVSASEIPFVV